ncbi:hypothetical protein TeGR_g6258, partial [Tetraparma gracilis]
VRNNGTFDKTIIGEEEEVSGGFAALNKKQTPQGPSRSSPSGGKQVLGVEEGVVQTSDAGESKLEERGAPAACLPEAIVVFGLDKGNLGSAKVGAKQTSASSSSSSSDGKKVRGHEEAAVEKEAMLGEENNSTGDKGVSTFSPAGLRKAIETAPKDVTKMEQAEQSTSERTLNKSVRKSASVPVLTDTKGTCKVSEDAVAASERQNSTGGKGVSTHSPAGLRKSIESAPKDVTKTEQAQQSCSERTPNKS